MSDGWRERAAVVVNRAGLEELERLSAKFAMGEPADIASDLAALLGNQVLLAGTLTVALQTIAVAAAALEMVGPEMTAEEWRALLFEGMRETRWG